MKKEEVSVFFGTIVKPHGVKGELRVDIKDPGFNEITEMESVFVEIDGKRVPFFVESISDKGPFAVLKLEGINSLKEAASLQSKPIFITKPIALEEGESPPSLNELISFHVMDIHAGDLGIVIGVEEGAQDRLVIDRKGKELLIPFTKPLVKDLLVESKEIVVDLPDGFLDIYE